MSKKLFLKILSVTLGLITFFYTSPIAAVNRQDKLAAQSRFSEYFSSEKNKDLLTSASLPVFTNAMVALNSVILNPTKEERDIVAVIGEQNVALKNIGVVIVNNVYYMKIGARKVPYLVLSFGEQGQSRDLFFLRDNNDWRDEELAQIGVRTPEDKDHLKVVGVAGSWITKYQEIIRGLAAGEEMVSPEEEILDLIVADIATNGLTIDEKRAILRRGKEAESSVLSAVRSKIRERLKAIEVAISEEVFNQMRVSVNAFIGGVSRWGVKRDDERDYFKSPSPVSTRKVRGLVMPAMPAVDTPISGADRFKALLEGLVKSALQKKERPQDKENLLRRFTVKLKAEPAGDRVAMKFPAEHDIDNAIETIFRVTGLDRFFGPDTRLEEQVIERMTNFLLIDPDVVTNDLDNKTDAMLEKIKTKAVDFGFTDVQLIPTQPDNATRIMEVLFVKRHSVKLSRLTWGLFARERLNVFNHTLSRLAALEEALGEQFVDDFIRNILIVERERTEFARGFLNDSANAKLEDDQLFRYAALFSYLAMAKADEKFAGEISLKENWPAIVGQYFWITHIYGNPDINMTKAVTMNEEEFGELVRAKIEGIVKSADLALVNRTLQKYFKIELPEGTNLVDLISRIVPTVWGIHNRFIDALGKKAGEHLGVTKRGMAAGEETGEKPVVIQKDPLEEIKSADHIVIDCKQWRFMFIYVRNPETGKIEEKKFALSSIESTFGFIELLQANELQLVFTSVINKNWLTTMVKAKRVIENNLAAVKIPNSIVRGEGVILIVDADGIIYVMPETGANKNALTSLKNRVQTTLALQNAMAKLEDAKHLKGFIDLDAKIFQIQNPDFQRLLYNRLQEVYNEGLYVARLVGQIEGEIPSDLGAFLNKFDERAKSNEWRDIVSTKTNTVTLVSSDNTQLAHERKATSTVIQLGFDLQLNLPQLSPAILIARAIISVGGEQNVTGGLLEDIKNLYLNMVPQELQAQVIRANSISELLAIILPPISQEDLRVIEYLMIGRKIAGIAA